MRLGDLDALKKYMCEICNDEYLDEPCEPSDCVFCNAIKDAPTIDAVPVVRCKDCKHFRDYTNRYGVVRRYCTKINHISGVEPEHYCSYGERKDGDGNG